jgi:hypothetical protein
MAPAEIVIKSKRCSQLTLDLLKEQGYHVVDVTSTSVDARFRRLSPFWPHGNIRVDGNVSESVEGLWQGLKVFESTGIDTTKFAIKTMKNIKRSCRKYGKVIGHSFQGAPVDYLTARRNIFLPAYNQLLARMTEELIELASYDKLVLLDYETNEDINNISKPLSHAGLIKRRLQIGRE